MSNLKYLYQHSLSLLTDLYQLTMAYGYWKSGRTNHQAVFHLFFRKLPFNGRYAIAAGLETAIEYLQQLPRDDSPYPVSLESYYQQLKQNLMQQVQRKDHYEN